MMKSGSALRLIVVALLVLGSCGAFTACDDDCHQDICLGCDGSCCHIFRCATFQSNCVDISLTSSTIATDQTAYLTQLAVTDIFRPPNSLL